MEYRHLAVCLASVLVALAGSPASAEARHEDHEQLRGMLRTVTDAINSRNFDALAPVFSERFSVVTMDQRRLTSFAEVKNYFSGFFAGDKPLLNNVVFRPQADEPTSFIGQDVGICHGTSQDSYDFADGDSRTMSSRWSAVVVKEHGKWKLASLHLGVNLMDNPILTALKASVPKAAAAGLLVGLLLGLLIPKARSALKV